MSVIKTGIIAPNAVLAETIRGMREVSATPIAYVLGRWLHEDAAESFSIWLDKQAVAAGLHEPARTAGGAVIHYGLSSDGEFTRWEPDPSGGIR